MKLKSAETSICACLNASTEPRMPDERRVLLQPDEVVQQRRDHAPHGLREHDRGERLAAREAERARGGLLARVHGLDPGAVHLGDVRGVDEDERDDPPERRRRRDPLDRERRRAEAEQRDHEDRRHAAEEVGVGDRERPDREEDRAGEAAQDREGERREEDDRLRDHEDLHVQEERAGDARERALVDVPVEEGRLDLGPVRCVRDRVDDDSEDDDRRDEREGDGAAGAATPEDLRVPAQRTTSERVRR